MQRIEYPLSHEWHVAINKHADEEKEHPKFMYEAKSAADEVPRMVSLFKAEHENKLPETHQQCSMQDHVPVENNHLTCCLGVKTLECPHLLALDKIQRCTQNDIYSAKAWTCAAHIISNGGDAANTGYMLRVDDIMYWNAVHESLASE